MLGKPRTDQHPQMLIAELGLDAAQEGRIADDGIEMGGDVRHGDRVALVADDTVQVGQRLGVAQDFGLRQDGAEHLEGTVGLGDEPLQLRVRLDLVGARLGALVEQALRPPLMLGRRQVEDRQVVAALVMGAVGAEGRVALLVDQPRGSVGEARAGILVGGHALGLEEQRPSRAEALQDVVEPGRDGDQLGIGGAVEVRAAVAQGPLERPVLVEHDAGADQAGPRQVVGDNSRLLPVLGKVQHVSAPL